VIPRSGEDLTPAWLAAVLDLPVTAAVREVLNDEIGFVSSIYRVRLGCAGMPEGAPASVVVKFTAGDELAAAGARTLDLYRREVNFYRHLAADSPADPPYCYHADIDASGERFVLVIEDVPGFDLELWRHGCGVAEARLVVSALADMHAKYWGGRGLESHDWMPTFCDSVAGIGELMERGLPAFKENYGHMMPAHLLGGMDGLAAAFPMLAQLGAESPHQTLSHTDCHLGNLIFHDGQVRFIDWQAFMIHGFAYDLAYFINGNLTVEARRSHCGELLDLYHQKLVEGGIDAVSRELVENHYRVQTMAQWVGIPMIIGAFLHDDPKGRRVVDFWAPRFFTALEDLDVAAIYKELMSGRIQL
jgi:hypothetical protein